MRLYVSAALATVLLMVSFDTVYAESLPENGSLHADLENDPAAQEILKNIEESKRWIEKIEKKDLEDTVKQKELEAKRSQILRILNNDLEKWQELWNDFTFDSMLERALIDTETWNTGTIYDHPLKFTASKIDAGRDAMHQAILDGGGPEEARNAFVNAAKISRVEMATANALYNVYSEKAYYNQQILFESDGTFDLDLSGDKLREYYEDYRASPEYLKKNPYDVVSWEALGKTDSDTECRDDYILVHRDRTGDYICTTEYTAEMWVRHGMGSPVNVELEMVPDDLDSEQIHKDRIDEKISSINKKIYKVHSDYRIQSDDMMKRYDEAFLEVKEQEKDEERIAQDKYSRGEMSRVIYDTQMTDIREKYDVVEKSMLKEKLQSEEIMKNTLRENLDILISKYEHDSEIRITWNNQSDTYYVETNV